jgi:hypothetical protein
LEFCVWFFGAVEQNLLNLQCQGVLHSRFLARGAQVVWLASVAFCIGGRGPTWSVQKGWIVLVDKFGNAAPAM